MGAGCWPPPRCDLDRRPSLSDRDLRQYCGGSPALLSGQILKHSLHLLPSVHAVPLMSCFLELAKKTHVAEITERQPPQSLSGTKPTPGRDVPVALMGERQESTQVSPPPLSPNKRGTVASCARALERWPHHNADIYTTDYVLDPTSPWGPHKPCVMCRR